jgi:hypothetical protein
MALQCAAAGVLLRRLAATGPRCTVLRDASLGLRLVYNLLLRAPSRTGGRWEVAEISSECSVRAEEPVLRDRATE